MRFHILTIFPKIFESYFNEGIIKRAQKKQSIEIKIYDLRDWTSDKHRSVDDSPYGGGAGMVMKIEPLYKAIRFVKSQIIPPFNNSLVGGIPHIPQSGCETRTKSQANSKFIFPKIKTVLLSAKGKDWNQQLAQKSSTKFTDLILICGRYEGVDERITKFIDEEISIGDYVLTGGEIGAMAIIDSITRLLPGVLGNSESAITESHSVPGVLEHPHYTRPEIFVAEGKKYKVPKILLTGDHKKIEVWRQKKSPKK